MQGSGEHSPAVCFDFTPQCRQGSSARQLNRHHCYAARFDYEHRPVFEEGQRLATRLSNSLVLAEEKQLRAHLVAVDVSKPPLKKSVDCTPRHKSADKRHTDRARVSLPIREDFVDNVGDCNVSDSALFSFDDVSMDEDEDDDEDGDNHDDNDNEVQEPSSSVAVKYLGKVLENCELGSTRLHAEQELKEVPQDVSVKDSDSLSLHSSKFKIEQSNPAEVSMQRNMHPRKLTQTLEALQQYQLSSELVLVRSVENLNISVNDAHRAKSELNGQSSADNHDCSHDVTVCDFEERVDLEFRQDCFGDDVPPGPLGSAFNRLLFARAYKLVALRVSLRECESLAYRLKGHLLNWPRISNIARVDGDDMDWDTMSLWENGKRKSEGVEDSLYQAVYGTRPPSGQMMKRAKSAEKLSFRHFEYLECISRPGRKISNEIKEERERQLKLSGRYSRKYYMVDLGDSSRQTKELCLHTGHPVLGSSMERWKGPFRLLLLDPKYAGKSELPMAVKMLLNESLGYGKRGPRREIVPCNLTLFYQYWSMEEILNYLLPSEALPIKVLGHVAVLQLGEQYSSVRFVIGKVILDKHCPKVKTVINKPETVEGWGLPTFEVLAGNHSLVTSIIENDLRFLVNLATVHWDSELAVERQRLIDRFSSDVFAGAGALALSAAKKVWRVFANDPNQDALTYLARNVDDNKLHAKVEVKHQDEDQE
ncbi:hypothetical protein L7F22_058810 [Adiantum nelumboides]|nr:hypothetical protein [Adiantum nelumboides]